MEREASNCSLGESGELLTLAFEQARLISLGKEALASKIKHTSKVTGEQAGVDILSFEKDGRESNAVFRRCEQGCQNIIREKTVFIQSD